MAETRTPRRSASSCASSIMLTAIESSCIGRLLERGQRRLTERDAAVVGRNGLVRPDERAAVEQVAQFFKQQFVLEDAARKHNGIERVLAAKCPARLRDALRQPAMEGARDGCRIAS